MSTEIATFAAGCFWGVEELFGKIPGVVSTRAGYSGGVIENPTYEDVCTSATGHAEAVEVVFDNTKVSYADLLHIFWSNHNPTTPNQQGPDFGTQYRSVIFYHSPEQKELAEKSKEELEKSGKFKKSIVTEIVPAAPFYAAEEYHQKYFAKRGGGSCHV
jgi:peptide-methionine (S)-S-oxide reductase